MSKSILEGTNAYEAPWSDSFEEFGCATRISNSVFIQEGIVSTGTEPRACPAKSRTVKRLR
ncbi:MAG: hypothetical protein CVU57_20930 [Deltaproteobacteria bacterium HGW-Deltaproteobacteria-15]|nr:MAG: hypothetical protein CVU57_20930 [Deltaproteobacteria bacterium HGW-Deltaproteobacteria-15]